MSRRPLTEQELDRFLGKMLIDCQTCEGGIVLDFGDLGLLIKAPAEVEVLVKASQFEVTKQ